MALIYMVEDESNIRELVVYTLKASGFDAVGFSEGESFFSSLKTQTPDLVLLDIMLPGISGLDILKEIKDSEATQLIPVIMLTAKDTEYDKVVGLDAGADDYIIKPFGIMELVSRIRATLRRVDLHSSDNGTLSGSKSIGKITISKKKHTVEVEGNPINLTLKEYELISIMMDHPGIVFTREMLLEQIWGYAYEGETRTVDVHIRSLRLKLGDASGYIETVRGVGYRFTEAV